MAVDQTASNQLAHFLSFESPILDSRSLNDYKKSHLRHSGHIPFNELQDRLHELPKSSVSIRLISNSQEIEQTIDLLKSKRYVIDASITWESISEDAQKASLTEIGERVKLLWSPTPALETFIKSIEEGRYSIHSANPSVIDIGCGSGRDLVFLGLKGWNILGLDYLQPALDKYLQLAKQYDIEAKAIKLDIEENLTDFVEMGSHFDLVQVFRYLHRPLLPHLKDKVKPGGYLIYQTFSSGCEAFGKPKKARFILKRGELAEIFDDFEILKDEIISLDDGRPNNLFIARKPTKNL